MWKPFYIHFYTHFSFIPVLHCITCLYCKQGATVQSHDSTTILTASAGQAPRGSSGALRPFHSGTSPVGYLPSRPSFCVLDHRTRYTSLLYFIGTLSSIHFRTLRLKTIYHIFQNLFYSYRITDPFTWVLGPLLCMAERVCFF
jgi:hypothetical protein